MNFNDGFTPEELAQALNRVLETPKYQSEKVQNFTELVNSSLTQHHRSEDNIWKDVAMLIMYGNFQPRHKDTLQKYATFCYFLFRNRQAEVKTFFVDKIPGKYGYLLYDLRNLLNGKKFCIS